MRLDPKVKWERICAVVMSDFGQYLAGLAKDERIEALSQLRQMRQRERRQRQQEAA
jgi:hypothetical protein